jgi:hypothetical protein
MRFCLVYLIFNKKDKNNMAEQQILGNNATEKDIELALLGVRSASNVCTNLLKEAFDRGFFLSDVEFSNRVFDMLAVHEKAKDKYLSL